MEKYLIRRACGDSSKLTTNNTQDKDNTRSSIKNLTSSSSAVCSTSSLQRSVPKITILNKDSNNTSKSYSTSTNPEIEPSVNNDTPEQNAEIVQSEERKRKRKAPLPMEHHTPPKSIVSKKKKVDNFNDAWLTDKRFEKWLIKSTDTKSNISAMCKYCSCALISHKSALLKHSNTTKHKALINDATTSKSISDMLKYMPNEIQTKRAELKLAALIATKNLSFNLLDTLTPLLKDIFPDSEIAKNMKLCRTKGQAVVKQILSPELKNSIIQRLKEPGSFFSCIIDETTDISVKKQCALSVISFNYTTNSVETNFFDIYEVESGTGEHLSSEMIKRFKNESIPIENLVGFAADTTNAMVGAHNSVFSHLKNELPNIACVKCSAHSIHLVASKACLTLPRSIEDMLRNIGSHFSRSSQRKSRLVELQKYFQEEIHTILSPCITRWLSLKPCVDRILEQKVVLKEYFTQELCQDPSLTTESIINTLNNSYSTIYLEFMSHTLAIFNEFNRLFQSERPLLHCLKPEVEKLLLNIFSNYIQIPYLKRTEINKVDFNNPGRFVSLEKVYLGVAAQHSLEELRSSQNPPPTGDVEEIYKKCLSFYIESAKEIKQRFKFDDPIYKCLEIVNPAIAQKYENKDMIDVIQRFPILNKFINQEELVKEIREHAFLDHEQRGLLTGIPAETYWKEVFSQKNMQGDELFPNLKRVMSLLLVLPFSNACVERVFSKLKQIKTDNRNKLHTSTIAALMNTSEGTKQGLLKFEPTQKMINIHLKYNKMDDNTT